MHTVVVLHYTYHITMACFVKGGKAVKMLKNIFDESKKDQETIQSSTTTDPEYHLGK